MPNLAAIELLASADRAASGVGAAVDIGALRRVAELVLDITAADGTALTLAVAIETSLTGGDWTVARTIETKAAVGAVALFVYGLKRYVRARWTIGGTAPSFTFTLAGTAEGVYCEPVDICKVVPERSIEELDMETRWLACRDASSQAEGSLRSAGFVMPLTSWGRALRSNCAKLAAAELFGGRGADTEGPDAIVFVRAAAATKWLDRVADNKDDPEVVDSTPDVFEGGAVVVSQTSRGW